MQLTYGKGKFWVIDCETKVRMQPDYEILDILWTIKLSVVQVRVSELFTKKKKKTWD